MSNDIGDDILRDASVLKDCDDGFADGVEHILGAEAQFRSQSSKAFADGVGAVAVFVGPQLRQQVALVSDAN